MNLLTTMLLELIQKALSTQKLEERSQITTLQIHSPSHTAFYLISTQTQSHRMNLLLCTNAITLNLSLYPLSFADCEVHNHVHQSWMDHTHINNLTQRNA